MTRREIGEQCARCSFGQEKRATATRTFALDGDWHEIKLCEPHAVMFDREWLSWSRYATDVDPPEQQHEKSTYFTAERARETQRIRELAERAKHESASREFAARRAAELDREQHPPDDDELEAAERAELLARQNIPGALKWRLTDHARERMIERGFTIDEVLRTCAFPHHVFRQPWRGPEIVVHVLNDCRVVVNDQTHAAITVIDRSAQLETAPPTPKEIAQ